MLMTSNEANKLLKQYREELNQEYLKEKQRCKYTLSIDESAEGNKPEYNFLETQDRIASLQFTIKKIKHAINQFNVSRIIEDFDMTIDALLVMLPMWNYRLSILKDMMNTLPKTRKSSLSKVVEYEYANYDIATVKAEYDSLAQKIALAQTALDEYNNTRKFELDV